MGSFVIEAAVSLELKQGVAWAGGLNGTWLLRTDADLVAGINNSAGAAIQLRGGKMLPADTGLGTFLARFAYSLSDDIISLDGDPAISFNGLPMGFVAQTATLTVSRAVASSLDQVFLQLNQAAETEQVIGALTYSATYDATFPFPLMLDILLNGFGVKFISTSVNGTLGVYNARISGTYVINSFSFAYSADPVDASTVRRGDTITLTSPGTDPDTDLDLDELEIFVDDVPITPIVQTQTLLTFLIPVGTPFGAITVRGVGNGTQFTGSEPLVTYTVTPVDGSGIYRLIPGETHDTIYEDTASGDDTVEVAITDIFFKTGLIGG